MSWHIKLFFFYLPTGEDFKREDRTGEGKGNIFHCWTEADLCRYVTCCGCIHYSLFIIQIIVLIGKWCHAQFAKSAPWGNRQETASGSRIIFANMFFRWLIRQCKGDCTKSAAMDGLPKMPNKNWPKNMKRSLINIGSTFFGHMKIN